MTTAKYHATEARTGAWVLVCEQHLTGTLLDARHIDTDEECDECYRLRADEA